MRENIKKIATILLVCQILAAEILTQVFAGEYSYIPVADEEKGEQVLVSEDTGKELMESKPSNDIVITAAGDTMTTEGDGSETENKGQKPEERDNGKSGAQEPEEIKTNETEAQKPEEKGNGESEVQEPEKTENGGSRIEEQEAVESRQADETESFYYEQKFTAEGVKVILTAEADVVPDNADVTITLIRNDGLEYIRNDIQGKMEDLTERQILAAHEEERSVFAKYYDLGVSVEQLYAFDFEINYPDDKGNLRVFEPENGQHITVSMEINGLSEAVTDEMREVELFRVPEIFSSADQGSSPRRARANNLKVMTDNSTTYGNTITFAAEHFSVYMAAIIRYTASASEEMLTAEDKAWNIINTYADPDYFLDDPYKESMTDAQYAELRQAAVTATAGCMTQYDKIKAITAFVADRTYYDYKYLEDKEKNPTFFKPYEIYTQKRAVCSGFARLVRTLLISIGIPCMDLHGENHEYNAVYDSTSRRWIFVDATWCSKNCYTVNEEWLYYGYSYSYFDLMTEKIAALTSHEVYHVDGLLDGGAYSPYYSLETDVTSDMENGRAIWCRCDWYLKIAGIKTADIVEAAGFGGFEVLELKGAAFRDSSLKKIDLSRTKISSIKRSGFNNCSGLESIVFPAGLTQIEDYAFWNCVKLGNIDLSGTKMASIGYAAFNKCSALESVIFSPELTSMGDRAFILCSKLKEADLSRTKITEIGRSAFNECSSLESVKFPSELTQIKEYAFFGCSKLRKIDFSKTKTASIGYAAFYDCRAADVVRLPDTVSSIGQFAFGCNVSSVIKTLVVTKLSRKKIGYADKSGNSIWSGREVSICGYLYSVKFVGNGATGGKMAAMVCGGGVTHKLPANIFRRANYQFTGWNTKKNGKGVSYRNMASIKNLAKKEGKSVTLYAQWKRTRYAITYKLNGGINNGKNASGYKKTSKTITLKNPIRKGYTFAGWYSNRKMTKKASQIKKGSTGNKTFYAKWKANRYTIKFIANHKLATGKMETLSCTYGKRKKISANRYKVKGYTFVGWNVKKDGSGKMYQNKAFIKNLTARSGGTIKFYAQWRRV